MTISEMCESTALQMNRRERNDVTKKAKQKNNNTKCSRAAIFVKKEAEKDEKRE
jgi:hypothetical protein